MQVVDCTKRLSHNQEALHPLRQRSALHTKVLQRRVILAKWLSFTVNSGRCPPGFPGWGQEAEEHGAGGEACTYQGLFILYQANNLHRLLLKILVDVIGQRGQNRIKVLLGNCVVYHEHSLPESQGKGAGTMPSRG